MEGDFDLQNEAVELYLKYEKILRIKLAWGGYYKIVNVLSVVIFWLKNIKLYRNVLKAGYM